MTSKPRTLYEKIWDAHVVDRRDDGTCLIYIDRHLIHEVASAQAFEALRLAGRKLRRPDLMLAVPDHNLPTTAWVDAQGKRIPIADAASATQLAALEKTRPSSAFATSTQSQRSRASFMSSDRSRASRCPAPRLSAATAIPPCHGGLGALAFGIGTSEIEHVMATQTLLLTPSKTMEVRVEGELGQGVTPKDVIMHVIGVIGTAGGTGHVIEYTGNVFREMSIEGRLTVSNMSIEAGGRAGLVAPDEKTYAYLKAARWH